MIAGAIMAGRAAIALCCVRGIPAARPDGLGAMVAGTVRPEVALTAFLFTAVVAYAGGDYRVLIVVFATAAATALLIAQARRRLGGMTGDVLGAACEIATAVALLGLSAL
jgi:adenosylcobinamide-GDP ribazoletransferase